jgi:hypothetical protein
MPSSAGQRFACALPPYRLMLLNMLSVALLWAYFRWLHPTFLEHMTTVYRSRQPDLALGLTILCMYPLEIIGIVLKLSGSMNNHGRRPNPSPWGVGLGGLILMGGLAVNALPSLMLFPALDLEKMNILKVVPALILLVLIFICWALPTAILAGQWNAFREPHQLQVAVVQPHFTWKKLSWETLGDLLLTLYSAMALTATWDFMLAISPPEESYSPSLLAFLFLIFVFFYSSSRALYSMEELITYQPWYVRLTSLVTLCLVGIQALSQL